MRNKFDDFIAPKCDESLGILYQDDSILVINKPSGLFTLSGKNPLNYDSVHYRLVKDFPTALMVHRLDFGTSGILLVALSKEVVKKLNQQFSSRAVVKGYEAIVDGVMKEDVGVIELPIAKGEFPYQIISFQNGKPSESHYSVIQSFSDRTHIRLTPHTGRTHQLRVHCAAIEHPILGCDLYGTDRTKNKAERLLLHASELTFLHPVTGSIMNIKCPAPF